MRLRDSPCGRCPFRKNGRCTLLRLTFYSHQGVYKCYALDSSLTFNDFLNDFLDFVNKEREFKAVEIARHLGISARAVASILEKLIERGLIEVSYQSSYNYYKLKVEKIDRKKIGRRTREKIHRVYKKWKRKVKEKVDTAMLETLLSQHEKRK